ncbi:MAG TPA: hypothetical protein VKX16_10385 [Chloroflexota bacterium]|nr:hypothetical protein [Chloroflexota bacterium]
MATIGVDCQLIIDGNGYFIEPGSYKVSRPRIRRADLTGVSATGTAPGYGAGERYVDRGPGKREFTFIVPCFNGMRDYTGATVATTGQQFHDNLQTSYNKVNQTVAFTDPTGYAWPNGVRFDDLVEELADVRSRVDGSNWYMHVTLVEA